MGLRREFETAKSFPEWARLHYSKCNANVVITAFNYYTKTNEGKK